MLEMSHLKLTHTGFLPGLKHLWLFDCCNSLPCFTVQDPTAVVSSDLNSALEWQPQGECVLIWLKNKFILSETIRKVVWERTNGSTAF